MNLNAEQRAAVVATAKTWLGTPYHHRAAVKGAGADCALFPVAVYRECGILPASYEPPEYSSQWHLHREEELYLAEIEKFCTRLPWVDDSHNKPELPILTPRPADFLVVQFGRTYSHGAIVIDWPICIHSYVHHGVTLFDALREGEVVGRRFKVYEVDLHKVNMWL